MKYDFKAHELANDYPMMMSYDYESLLNSIERFGYDKAMPIVIFDGQILDGRNRYKACLELGVEPSFKEFNGTTDEAEKLSVKLNATRRHMSKSQKAMVAAFKIIKSRKDETIKKITIKQAVIEFGVSERYINEAINLYISNYTIAENVFDGTINLYQARLKIQELDQLVSNSQIVYDELNHLSIGDTELNLQNYINGDEKVTQLQADEISQSIDLNEQIKELKRQLDICKEQNLEMLNSYYCQYQ